MLHAIMMLRVIGDVPSALRVSIKGSRSRLTFPDALNKFPKVNDVLRNLKLTYCEVSHLKVRELKSLTSESSATAKSHI